MGHRWKISLEDKLISPNRVVIKQRGQFTFPVLPRLSYF